MTVDCNGTFSYDPTVSAALQALPLGGALVDTFEYAIVSGGVPLNEDGLKICSAPSW